MTMSRNGQKYNFLVALCRQVKEAARDGDEVYEEWCGLVSESSSADGEKAVDDGLNAWVAQIEARVEDLEQGFELIAGEEGDSDDDGDDDEDMRRHERRLGSDTREPGRVSENLARAPAEPGGRADLSLLDVKPSAPTCRRGGR